MLKLLKSIFTFRGPFENSPFLGQVVQRLRNCRKVADESVIIARQATESVHFSNIARPRPRSNRSYFIQIALNAMTTNNMSKERYFALKLATLRRFQLKTLTIKPIKHSRQALKMLVKGLRKDKNVV